MRNADSYATWWKKLLHAFIALALVGLGAGIPLLFTQKSFQNIESSFYGKDDSSVLAITWQELRSYDYKQGILPQFIKEKIDHPRVALPGFAVPLTAGVEIDHFLYVPSRAYCIHVPPPPPHLMVEVKLDKGVSYSMLQGALMLTGKLQLQKRDTMYGQASWYLEADTIKPYRP